MHILYSIYYRAFLRADASCLSFLFQDTFFLLLLLPPSIHTLHISFFSSSSTDGGFVFLFGFYDGRQRKKETNVSNFISRKRVDVFPRVSRAFDTDAI